jgi:hypothetical protein
MAKSKNFIGQHTALTIVIIIIISFAAGFLLARLKYKPQIQATYDMVMERENVISDLKTQLKEVTRISEE